MSRTPDRAVSTYGTVTGVNDSLAEIARRQHGVFSRRQAIRTGHTAAQIASAIADNLWQQVHPGVFTVRGAPVTHLSRAWAARLAIPGTIAFTGRTAAILRGVPDVADGAVEVVILNRRREIRLTNVIVRRVTAAWLSTRTTDGVELPVVSAAAMVFDLAASWDEPRVRRATEWLLRERALSLPELDQLRRRGRPGSAVVRSLIRVLSDSDDYWARRCGALLEAAGLPKPKYNVHVRTSIGSAYLDIYFADHGRAIEIDDYESHSRPKRFRRDRRRHNAVQDEHGILINYFTPVDVRDAPDEVVATMRRALERAAA